MGTPHYPVLAQCPVAAPEPNTFNPNPRLGWNRLWLHPHPMPTSTSGVGLLA